MIALNLYSSVQCGAVAAATLKVDGLLVFTGSDAALHKTGTGGMIAYGVSKVFLDCVFIAS